MVRVIHSSVLWERVKKTAEKTSNLKTKDCREEVWKQQNE